MHMLNGLPAGLHTGEAENDKLTLEVLKDFQQDRIGHAKHFSQKHKLLHDTQCTSTIGAGELPLATFHS